MWIRRGALWLLCSLFACVGEPLISVPFCHFPHAALLASVHVIHTSRCNGVEAVEHEGAYTICLSKPVAVNGGRILLCTDAFVV